VFDLGENGEARRPVFEASSQKHSETELRKGYYRDSRVGWWAGDFGRLGPDQE